MRGFSNKFEGYEDLSFKSKALLNLNRLTPPALLGSIMLIFVGAGERAETQSSKLNHAAMMAAHVTGQHLIEYGLAGAGASIAVFAATIIPYIKTSGNDWHNAERARQQSESTQELN